uniref:Uncharacterized protein n=1 Tax=Arundo donax TaxID=35708 RepID=A0A0A9ES15_ARUDO
MLEGKELSQINELVKQLRSDPATNTKFYKQPIQIMGSIIKMCTRTAGAAGAPRRRPWQQSLSLPRWVHWRSSLLRSRGRR